MTMCFERGQAAEPRGKGMPSVTLKLAMDRNGAVDNMAEGPKRFTSQESLDAGEKTGMRGLRGARGWARKPVARVVEGRFAAP